MLITRGFGNYSGTGTGETIYVSVTNPELLTKESGYKSMSSTNKLPSFISDTSMINPQKINTAAIKTN